ncbi:MAG: serine/threonine protein kinase [Bryobacterales bacterium]|nr:serine/threonine protein kinase [Bryobacterales bacterium]
MNAERWARVKHLFQEALAVEPQSRVDLLDRECGEDVALREEVDGLLASYEDISVSLDAPTHVPLFGSVLRQVREEVSRGEALIGQTIGQYRIESLIGEGGMGSVYLGIRDDAEFKMHVAIKVLNRSSSSGDIVNRFRLERRILARLNHPFIARLFDGGVSEDGLLYFVMEYIPGVPLDEYLRRTNPGLEARLQLFREICSAVSFAHQNLVVHSDIKASNILIMEGGIPKLLDFGISQVLDLEHREPAPEGEGKVAALTPAYASPEQLRGLPLSTASDIYSMGVLLYEMICGRHPYEVDRANPFAILSKIEAGDPPKLAEISSLAGVQADLDAIVCKAIQPEPKDRYITANQFSRDVERYIKHQPVVAWPDSHHYRLGKFVRRNRVSVAVGAFAILSLLGGIFASVYMANRAQEQRLLAEARFQDVRQLANSLIFDLDTDLAQIPGATGVRGKLVERALEYLDRLDHESRDDLELQRELASAYEKLGDVQGRPNVANIGNSALALECYRKALSIREEVRARRNDIPARQDIASTYSRLSALAKLMGDYEGGLKYDRDALRMYQEMLALEPANIANRRKVASAYTSLGGGLSQIGDWDGVLETRRQALRMFEEIQTAGSDDPEDIRGLCLAHRRLGGIYLMLKNRPQAENHFRKALSIAHEMIREHPGDSRNVQDLAASATALGGLLYETGQFEEAMDRYREAIEIHEQIAASDPLDARNRSLLASNLHRLARTMIRTKNPKPALPYLIRGLTMRQALVAENPMNAGGKGEVGESHMLMGDYFGILGDKARALASYRRAMTIFEELQAQGKENAILEIERRETSQKVLALEGRAPKDS